MSKKLYDTLLESEELHDIFSGMTGEWEKDKVRFTKLQKEMEDISLDLNTEEEEYE